MLSVSDKAVITSGSYKCYFIDAYGKKYEHITDLATGCPAIAFA